MKRLLIVADNTLVIHSIRLALRQTAGFRIVGFVDGRHPITRHLEHAMPDVVLVDDMQNMPQAIARLAEVTEHGEKVQSLLLSTKMDAASMDEAFNAGAGAVLSKSVHPVALGTLLRETVNGNVVHCPRPATESPAAANCPLTARELEILRLAAQGYTNGRIARDLWVTEQTVKFHLSNTYRKLGVRNRTEASRYAHVNRLVEPDVALAS